MRMSDNSRSITSLLQYVQAKTTLPEQSIHHESYRNIIKINANLLFRCQSKLCTFVPHTAYINTQSMRKIPMLPQKIILDYNYIIGIYTDIVSVNTRLLVS